MAELSMYVEFKDWARSSSLIHSSSQGSEHESRTQGSMLLGLEHLDFSVNICDRNAEESYVTECNPIRFKSKS